MTFEQIAQFALAEPEIPDTSLDFAATLLIDTLGVAAGASGLDVGHIVRDHAVAFHNTSNPDAAVPLLFDGRRCSIPGAAFAAASQIDNLDAHDGYNPTKGHIGCAAVPALLAFASARPELSGPDALRALVLSYEIGARAAIALHASVTDYHTSGAWNALAVAALGCRLTWGNTEQLRHAFGIAEYHGPRSQMMREIANPTMLHDGSGMGALVGSMATLLAADGFTGAPALTVEDAVEHWADLGTRWTIEENYIKPYPICRWAHASLDGLGALMKTHGFGADDVHMIEVNTFAEAAQLFAGLPDTTSQAQYSLPFALSVLLAHGRIGPEHISGAGLQNPNVARLLPRIHVRETSRHSDRFPLGRWSDVTVTLNDGSQFSSGDVHARGGPEAPMDLTEIEAKFHVMAAPVSTIRRQDIWAMRARLLEPDARFEELARLVCAPLEDS